MNTIYGILEVDSMPCLLERTCVQIVKLGQFLFNLILSIAPTKRINKAIFYCSQRYPDSSVGEFGHHHPPFVFLRVTNFATLGQREPTDRINILAYRCNAEVVSFVEHIFLASDLFIGQIHFETEL